MSCHHRHVCLEFAYLFRLSVSMRKVAGEYSFYVLIYMNTYIFHICFISFILLSYLIFDFICLRYHRPTHKELPNTHAHTYGIHTHRHTHQKGKQERGKKKKKERGRDKQRKQRHSLKLGKKRRESSERNYYIISPRVIIKAIIIISSELRPRGVILE